MFSAETSNLSSQSNQGEVAEENIDRPQEARVCTTEKSSALNWSEDDFDQRECGYEVGQKPVRLEQHLRVFPVSENALASPSKVYKEKIKQEKNDEATAEALNYFAE